MSMLSAQVDELRERAAAFEGYQNGEISRLMREAADTILSLRDRAQDLQAENAELRKLLASSLIVAGFDGRQYLDAYLQEEEGTTLARELKSLGIEV